MSLLDDVMEVSMDEVESAPEFIDPPAGLYEVEVKSVAVREVNVTDKETGEIVPTPVVGVTYTVLAVKQLNNPNDLAPSEGDMFSESFFLNRPEFFKRYAKSVLGEDELAGKSIREVIDALEGVQMQLVVKLTKGKDGDKVFLSTTRHTRM